MDDPLDKLRLRALDGDRDALDELVGRLVDDVYQLSVRMLWETPEAEDATQEILTKVVTKLATFEAKSSIKTWVYRIAVNHLIDRQRRKPEDLTFDVLAADLADGLADPSPEHQPELEALAYEVKVTCTGAMLLCLDRPHRVAYLLGEILDVPGPIAAEVMGVDPAAFRKRLQRARNDIRNFMRANCGLVSTEAACRCSRRVNRAVELGRIGVRSKDEQRLAKKAVEEIHVAQQAEQVMRSTAQSTPDDVMRRWKTILDRAPALMRDQ